MASHTAVHKKRSIFFYGSCSLDVCVCARACVRTMSLTWAHFFKNFRQLPRRGGIHEHIGSCIYIHRTRQPCKFLLHILIQLPVTIVFSENAYIEFIFFSLVINDYFWW